MDSKQILAYNRDAWDREARGGKSEWTIPVSTEQIAAARRGDWSVVLTETKSVPRDWFPDMKGCDVLCLASGGGQQGPIFSAAGARVTVLDNSPEQLARDRLVAARENLSLQTVEGDMADLSRFGDGSFDLVFHPTSNLFAPNVRPVWREAFRVLCPGGLLLAGSLNPVVFLFDRTMEQRGVLQATHPIPYSDLDHLSPAERAQQLAEGSALEFGHTLDDLLAGQLEAGFVLTALYEDRHRTLPVAKLCATYLATRAQKPPLGKPSRSG